MSMTEAKTVFNTLCRTLDNMGWRYDKDESKLVIFTGARGEDLSMRLNIKVDADRNVMFLKSPMPFEAPKDKSFELAIATTMANWTMLNGCFEVDLSDNWCAFKIVIPFMGCTISEEACNYMIRLSCSLVDKFNDKFDALVKDRMSLEEFAAFCRG